MNFDQIMETLIKLATPTKTIKEEEIIKYFIKKLAMTYNQKVLM